MSFKTNTNIKPFYDDFSEKNDYYRILFRAGNAVQARELTQLQTIIQNQIKQFGDNLYKDGSKLQGGDIYLSDERWIETNKEDAVANKIVPGTILLSNNDDSIRATVLFRFENDDSLFLFVKYENDNRFDETKNVSYYKNNDEKGVLLNLDSAIGAGIGSFAAVSEGYYYVRGAAARVEDSVILISAKEQKTFEQFDNDITRFPSGANDLEKSYNPLSISIGFNILEKIYTEEDDEQLYDNSAGFLNKISKGAARLKIKLELTQKKLDEIDDNFVEIIKFEDGVKEVENDRTIFNEINNQIAKRTFETSGNFLNDQFIVTAGDVYNDENDNNTRKIKLNVDAGDGYVSGYRVETFGSKEFIVDAPDNTDSRQVNVRQYIGNYFKVENLLGVPTPNEIITLQNTDISGNVVDIAKGYFRYVRKSSAGYFEVYLYNIKTIERIFLGTELTSSTAVEEGDVVIGQSSKARGIINKPASDEYALNITDIKGSFIEEGITIIKSDGSRDSNTITAISRRDLSEVREMSNGDGTFTADIILDDSHKLSGKFISHRTKGAVNFLFLGVASSFTTELKVGDRLSMVADNEDTSDINKTYRYFITVGGIPTDNLLQIRSSSGIIETTTYTPAGANDIPPAKTEVTTAKFKTGADDDSENGDFTGKIFSDITVQRARLQEPSQTPLLAKLPNNRINKALGVNHKITKILKCGITGNTITLSGNEDNSFTGAETSAVIFATVGSTRIDISPVDGQANQATATIPDGYAGASKIQLTFPITKINLTNNPPTFNTTNTKKSLDDKYSIIDGDKTNQYGKNYADQEFLLNHKDVLEITGVYDLVVDTDNTITATKDTNNNVIEESYYTTANKKDLFSLDSGQRDGFITFGILERKVNIQAPTKPLIVFYKHYTQTGIDNFASVDSYRTNTDGTGINTDYSKIPFYKNTPLTDSIDFRLLPPTDTDATLNTTNLPFGENTGCPPPDSAVSAYISYYLPRVDSFFVSKDGIIKINKGKSSLNPSPPPNENKNEIKIADVFLTPYVFSNEEISIKRYEYPNYTKNDIKKLENRIDNLEEFVTLSLLEKDAAALSVVDNNGFERTKTGLVVENFNTRNRTFLGDMAHPSYKCATGENILKCRERRIPLELILNESKTKLSDNNVKLHDADGVLSLDYGEVSFINQPLSSFSISVNPYAVTVYKGKVDLNIAQDNWVETKQTAAVHTGQSRFVQENSANFVPQKNSLSEALREGSTLRLRVSILKPDDTMEIVTLTRIFKDRIEKGIQYWRGQKESDKTWVEFTTAQLGRSFLEKYGSTKNLSDAQITSWLDNEVAGGDVVAQKDTTNTDREVGRRQITTTTTTTRETTVRRIDANINEENTAVTNREVFDRRQTKTQIPFMRSRAINFNANGLKPNTKFYPFFDDDNISQHCIPITKKYKIAEIRRDANDKFVIVLENPAPFAGATAQGQEVVITDLKNKSKDFRYSVKSSVKEYKIDEDSADNFLTGVIADTTNTYYMIWSPKKGESLFSDNRGDISGQFIIPTANYRTERRIFSLSEDISEPNPSSHKISSCSNSYIASGTLVSNTNLTRNVTRPTINLNITNITNNNIINVEQSLADNPLFIKLTKQRATAEAALAAAERAEEAARQSAASAASSSQAARDAEAARDAAIQQINGFRSEIERLRAEGQRISRAVIAETNERAVQTAPPPRNTNRRNNISAAAGQRDPVAQTFFIDGNLLTNSISKTGIYVSSVEVFFAKREEILWDTQGVICELVTVENGYPSQNILSAVHPESRDEDTNEWFVKLSEDATVPTKFTFDSPVFLETGVEYAIVLKSNSNNYHVYVANIGDKDVTTGKLIAGQPHLGSFFTSQNASTWNADQNKDLKFRINRCQFNTTLPAGFDMLFPPLPLYDGAVLEYRGHEKSNGNKIFLLRSNNHGFDDADATANKSIEFFYPVEADNDLGTGVELGSKVIGSTGDYSGSFIIEDIIDRNKLLVSIRTADISNDGNLTNGNLSPIAVENRLRFDEGQFNIENTIPPGTDASTETSSLSYIRTDDELTDVITIGENKVFNTEKIIDDDSNNTPREKISTIISSNDEFLSPMFSTNSATFIIMKNLIDKPKSTKVFDPNLAGYDTIDTVKISKLAGIDDFIPSTDGRNDSNDAVYVTKKLLLEESSNSLKVLFDSVEEEGADIKIFYKTQESDSGDFDDISWTLLNTEEYNELNPKRVSSSADDFIEREFEVATPNNFSAYALKFVMTTDNKPPIIKRLRIIAVAD